MLDNAPWEQIIDFAVKDGGFVADDQTAWLAGPEGQYIPTIGWSTIARTADGSIYTTTTSATLLDIRLQLPFLTKITSVTRIYSLAKGTFVSGGINNFLGLYNNGTFVAGISQPSISDPDGTDKQQTISGSYLANHIYFTLRTSIRDGAGIDGSGVVKRLIIQGLGLNPFLTNHGPADCGCGVHSAGDAEAFN